MKYDSSLCKMHIAPSRPARGAWIEIAALCAVLASASSRPARGAWIEIGMAQPAAIANSVAPRKGRVD